MAKPQSETFRFTENKGQVTGFNGEAHPEVKFVTNAGDLRIFVLETGLAYQFVKIDRERSSMTKLNHVSLENNYVETFRMDMVLEGADNRAAITTEGKNKDFENYYTQNAFDVRSYSQISFHDVYPGIDWVLKTSADGIKYEFIVRPGADPQKIKMRFLHQESISKNGSGDIVLQSQLGTVSDARPVSFQKRDQIETSFS